jgi:fatty-acyl-CoA synthase
MRPSTSVPEAATFGGLLAAAAAEAPDREALILGAERLTYAELHARARGFARSLIGLGVAPGETVAALMPNCADLVVALFGTALAGALFLPVNARFRPRELAYVLADGEARVLVTSDVVAEQVDYVARIREALPLLDEQPAPSRLEHVVLLGRTSAEGMLDRAGFAAAADDEAEAELDRRAAAVTRDDLALMLYTSGTTAMPKGCPLRHRNFLNTGRQIAERFAIGPTDRLWDPLPLFHSAGILPLIATFHARATFVSMVHFDVEAAAALIAAERATLAWPAYLTIWQPILSRPGFDPAHLASIRHILCVGPGETLRLMERSLPGAPIVSCYGITEGAGIPVMGVLDDTEEGRTDTGGRPFDGFAVEIRDPETGAALPVGERGALCLRGEDVVDGYWKDPEKTAKAFDADGWFDTGDLASLDAEGRVRFHGRLKDTLKVGGENVAAVEVEALLSTHPAVELAAVVGVPDPKYGEVPAAFLQLRQGAETTDDAILAFCRAGLAGFKVPRHVRYVTEWPMSATKIRKDDLRGPLLTELGIAE